MSESFCVAMSCSSCIEGDVQASDKRFWTVGRGWLVHLWRDRDLGEQLCNSAAHAWLNDFHKNATKLIKLLSWSSWSSWSSSQFTLSIFFHHKLFQVCFTLFACDFLSLVADVIFVDLSSEVWRGIQRIYEWAAGNAFCTSLSWQSHSNHPWSWLPLGWCLLLSEWMVRLASSWTRQQLFLPWRGVRSLLWSLGKDLSWILEHHHGRFVSRVRIRWSIFAWHPEERCRCRICNSVIGRWHVSACSSQMLNARTAASLGCIILSILSSKVIILWGKVVKSTVFVYKQQYVQDIRKPLEVGRHLL